MPGARQIGDGPGGVVPDLVSDEDRLDLRMRGDLTFAFGRARNQNRQRAVPERILLAALQELERPRSGRPCPRAGPRCALAWSRAA